MIAYKVVKRIALDNLVSAFAEGKAMVEYVPNKVTVAPKKFAIRGYHLLAFNNFGNAKEYTENNFGLFEIWEAYVEENKILSKLPISFIATAVDDGSLDGDSRNYWIKGTMMCKSLTLIKDVTLKGY